MHDEGLGDKDFSAIYRSGLTMHITMPVSRSFVVTLGLTAQHPL